MTASRLYRYRAIPANDAGRYSVQNVPPGEYRLYAWDEHDAAPSPESELPPAATARSAKVSVREGARERIDLSVISPEARTEP